MMNYCIELVHVNGHFNPYRICSVGNNEGRAIKAIEEIKAETPTANGRIFLVACSSVRNEK